MEVIRIQGEAPLRGEVFASGAKNAALPIFAATLLTDQPCTIENVPDLSDVRFMGDILSHLGAEVSNPEPGTWRIRAKEIAHRAPYDLVRKMRASICLLGPLVGRERRAEVSLPGGCVIGPRPIDLHLKGLARLGCEINVRNGYVHIDAAGIRGAEVFLGGRHGSTATGTANIAMAAVLSPGKTRIEGAACEPEVVDLCRMLRKMGASIEGIGSHELEIEGVDRLNGCDYRILPDRIEAGTFILASAITGGNVTVRNVVPAHLDALFDKLTEANVPFSVENDSVSINGTADRRPIEIITHPHPGFPTDLQAQACALMAMTPGLSIITERIFPNRFMHVPELLRMGAEISIEGSSAIINGKSELRGAPVMASDLRASAALVLAGLAAKGETWIQRVYHIDRGYEKIDAKLRALGAGIERLPADAMPTDALDTAM